MNMPNTLKSLVVTILSLYILIGCTSVPELTDNQKLAGILQDGGLVTEETDRGLVIYLPALFFDYGSSTLITEAQDKIRYIGNTVNQDFSQNRAILIEGHTDSKGNDEYNLELSKQRALSVADELVFSQVSADRIQTQWYGETAPIAPNSNDDGSDNPEGRAKNRRVEFIILNP